MTTFAYKLEDDEDMHVKKEKDLQTFLNNFDRKKVFKLEKVAEIIPDDGEIGIMGCKLEDGDFYWMLIPITLKYVEDLKERIG